MDKKGKKAGKTSSATKFFFDPECPFREFKDTELGPDLWGMNPVKMKSSASFWKHPAAKTVPDLAWADDQTQPLPRSVRQYLDGWVRAEELAEMRWEVGVTVSEDSPNVKMSVTDFQLTHAQVLFRSSFCRNVLCICYALERADISTVEHQCDVFTANFGPEGWRARYHIYSPGMKPGGGTQHKPTLSKNGCYLVRLFYSGTWRFIWVNDQVPVDATGSPLLPFSPITTIAPPPAKGPKQPATMIISDVLLWPLLMCKALLKLAAPDMNDDEDDDECEDEPMEYFDILYALTGGLVVHYPLNPRKALLTIDEMWSLLVSDIHEYSYDDEDGSSKGKMVKKTKDMSAKSAKDAYKGCTAMIQLKDTKTIPVYILPGLTPAHEMYILVDTVRDVPLKKPLPEPEVPQWKTYRWVDWAKRHGLYEAFEFPRTKFIKAASLMKLSYAPHLLDVQSTESNPKKGKDAKEVDKNQSEKKVKEFDKHLTMSMAELAMLREQLRDWVPYNSVFPYISTIKVAYYPSQYQFASCGDAPPVRASPAKMANVPKQTDVQAPKQAPLYVQVDSSDQMRLRLSLESVHPRVLFNCGMPILDYVEMSYVFLEEFKLFEGCDLPLSKGFIETRGYQGITIILPPGRHFFRLWVHAAVHWFSMLASEASIVIGTRDAILAAAVKECPWIHKYLMNINQTFMSWAKTDRAAVNVRIFDNDFYSSYKPDLEWDEEKIGYKKHLLHWMFRQALQSLLKKRLFDNDFRNVCSVFRKYLADPNFGIPKVQHTWLDLHGLVENDPCDCPEPEMVEVEPYEDTLVTEGNAPTEEVPRVKNSLLLKLLEKPSEPYSSVLCDLATPKTSCGVLKAARNKYVLRHDAAIVIQAYWRGFWARKSLFNHSKIFTVDLMKLALDAAFGNTETLTALMNEFFTMFPGTKDAYTIGHALGGIYSFNQHSNVAHVTPKCKWVPFFQEVFFCHAPVKVHFDISSTLTYNTYAVFNNDDGQQLPQTFNAHTTFHIEPNNTGYTVIGHGTLHKPTNSYSDVHWQLSVLTNTLNTFHVCDKLSKENENPDTQPGSFVENLNVCKEMPFTPAVKMTMEEIYVPNRRKILGGMQITCFQHDSICFRAEATNPTLEMEATLRTTDSLGLVEEIAKCSGVGELYWPFLRLEPHPPATVKSRKSLSQVMLTKDLPSARGKSKTPKPSSAKAKSSTKLKDIGIKLLEPKCYIIEVTTPTGWALTLQQWEKVDIVRNDIFEFPKPEPVPSARGKSAGGEKTKSAKDQAKKEPDPLPSVRHHDPEPDDAYIEMECSITANGALGVKRDEERAITFINATMSWEALQPRRNARGELLRQQFRDENLLAPAPTENLTEDFEHELNIADLEELNAELTLPNPTPVTESDRVSEEAAEIATYFTMPDLLRDKFMPLMFVEECTRERIEEDVIYVTPEMAEAAKNERHDRIESALERMRELRIYNEIYVLGRQKKRIRLLERLLIDSQHSTDILESFDERDNCVSTEVLARVASANRKKAQQAAASKGGAGSKGKK